MKTKNKKPKKFLMLVKTFWEIKDKTSNDLYGKSNE
jgi:hypothetical protein